MIYSWVKPINQNTPMLTAIPDLGMVLVTGMEKPSCTSRTSQALGS